jgi:glycogen debranching enzyme
MAREYLTKPGLETQMRGRAQVIKDEFGHYFKMNDGELPMAVDGQGRPVKLVVSNPGQLLFCEMLDKHEQREVVARLMGPDLLTDYGIRTEGSREQSFKYDSYQNGSVWPFDNWVIYQGMKKCGFDQEAQIIKESMIRAYEALGGLPEAYSVNANGEIGAVRNACRIQAWSAGALVNLLDEAPLI